MGKLILFIVLVIIALLLFGCSSTSTQNKCGNNICDANESFVNCSRDCNSNVVVSGKCGDGICGNIEKANSKLCPKDCNSNSNTINNNKKCGDGFCDAIESTDPLVCPEDCKSNTSADFNVLEDLAYETQSEKQKLDLYLPKNVSGKIPVIIEIHGGGFEGGNKSPSPNGQKFVQNGYAVAAINYRLSGEAKYPAANYDVKSAVRWLRANAEKYNLDINNFGAIGGSAGGYFVSFLGTTGDVNTWDVGDNLEYSSSVQAVVDQYGLVNFKTVTSDRSAMGYPTNDVENKFIGCVLSEENCTNATIASPVNYISLDDPPFILIHGSVDSQIPIKQSEDFYSALQAVGVESQLIVVQGANHGGPEFYNTEHMTQYLEFFDKHLKD